MYILQKVHREVEKRMQFPACALSGRSPNRNAWQAL
nr:MAG TPA: hypothetical protein [Caudoviricetes sp.]DAT87362.1 MAG TPA: hypothetical protein [Caudoviricetes sp.]